MSENKKFRISNDLKIRREHFGALARFSKSQKIFKLSYLDLFTIYVCERSLKAVNPEKLEAVRQKTGMSFNEEDVKRKIKELCQLGLLTESHRNIKSSYFIQYEDFCDYYDQTHIKSNIVKPFWCHLQLFKFCNLECLHCYCNGGSNAPKLRLSINEWETVIDKLYNYGIFEIYITGGETLILPETFILTKRIIDYGLVTGLSTNAISISKSMISFIESSGIERIQVSLDGATATTNDFIRNQKGAFIKACKGIKKLKTVTTPVINCVVNKINYHEIEDLVNLGLDLGCNEFKFFPQKLAGRAQSYEDLMLNKHEAISLIKLCSNLEKKYNVTIETIENKTHCGSGRSGFCIDDIGDLYPCIFGIEDEKQKLGNIFIDDLDEIWDTSDILSNFRENTDFPCNNCAPSYIGS